MATNHKKEMGRAKNAALSFFEHKLHIPKIYIDADWDGQRVDLLALDRSGIGDAHVVLMFVREYLADGQPDFAAQSAAMETLRLEFEHIAGHYKYIAAVETARLPTGRPCFAFLTWRRRAFTHQTSSGASACCISTHPKTATPERSWSFALKGLERELELWQMSTF